MEKPKEGYLDVISRDRDQKDYEKRSIQQYSKKYKEIYHQTRIRLGLEAI